MFHRQRERYNRKTSITFYLVVMSKFTDVMGLFTNAGVLDRCKGYGYVIFSDRLA